MQTIQPELLPHLPNRNLDEISSGKISYVLTVFNPSKGTEDLLFSFWRAQICVRVTTDTGLQSRPLFAGFVAGGADDNCEEAEVQLLLLFAARSKKLIQLSSFKVRI